MIHCYENTRGWFYKLLGLQLVLAVISVGIEAVHYHAVHEFYMTLKDTGRHLGTGSYHEPALLYSWVKCFSIFVFWIPFLGILFWKWGRIKQVLSSRALFLCFGLIVFSVCGEAGRILVVAEFGDTHEHDLNLGASLSYIQDVLFPVFMLSSIFAVLSPLLGLWVVYQSTTILPK